MIEKTLEELIKELRELRKTIERERVIQPYQPYIPYPNPYTPDPWVNPWTRPQIIWTSDSDGTV